jgi:uncharacterized membrane protein YgcG
MLIMQSKKISLNQLGKLSLIASLLIFLFLFQACKKTDIVNSFNKNSPVVVSTQAKDFFTISVNSPVALKAIVKEMQNQLKENDVKDFLNWHGQLVWSKIIKFEKDKNGSVTYAIPTQKDGEITGFFAATIDKANTVKLEMHRKSAILSNKGEYTYSDINANKRNAILQIFINHSAVKSTESNNLGDIYCWYEWVSQTTFQKLDLDQDETTIVNKERVGYWLIHCVFLGGGGGGNGGGGTGGGGGGNEGCGGGGHEETLNYKWWGNEASLLSPCELIEVVNRLSALLGLNTQQIHFLMQRPDITEEIDRYVGGGGNQQNNQIAYDHLDNMTQDVDYFNFVLNHVQTGDPLKMWWEDENWLKINVRFGIDDDPNAPLEDPTPGEIVLTLTHPIEAYLINKNASTAKSETITRFGTNGLNDRSDAFRHSFWIAINTKFVGAPLALQFSIAHEQGTPSQFQLESTMDTHNNLVGVGLCPQPYLTIAYLAQSAWNAVLAGDCWYLDPINYSDPCFWGCIGNSLGTHGITNQTQVKPTN